MPQLFPDLDRVGLPQTTLGGIFYEIDAFSYREAWVPGANRTVITCRVDATESFEWVTAMVGRVYVTGTTLRRDLPEQNPFDEKQWCTKVEQIDQGGLKDGDNDADGDLADMASGWPFTKWQRYRVTFEGMPFQVLTDAIVDTLEAEVGGKAELYRYLVRNQKTYAREQQIPGGGFYTIGSTPPAGKILQTGFKTRVYGDITYTRVRVPVGHFPAELKSHRGKINSAAFDSYAVDGGYGFAAGELLYAGYDDTNRYFDANEDWVCDLVLNFKFCQGGWNFFYSKTGVLVEVSSNGTAGGVKPYTTADMLDLFTVD